MTAVLIVYLVANYKNTKMWWQQYQTEIVTRQQLDIVTVSYAIAMKNRNTKQQDWNRTSKRQYQDSDASDNITQQIRFLRVTISVDTLARHQGRLIPSQPLYKWNISYLLDCWFGISSVDCLHLWLLGATIYWSQIVLETVDKSWGVLLIYKDLPRNIQYFGLVYVVGNLVRIKTTTPVVVTR